ncbi:MAG TPA: hypothetical protein V6C91_08095 [Coleofasciculaceae cyanobacterium]
MLKNISDQGIGRESDLRSLAILDARILDARIDPTEQSGDLKLTADS